MKLSEWLKQNRYKGKEFAHMAGISEPFVTFLKKGQRYPSPEVLARITAATNGEVTAADFTKEGIKEDEKRV